MQAAVQHLFLKGLDLRQGIPRVLLGISGGKHQRSFRVNEGTKPFSLLNRIGLKLVVITVSNRTNLRYLARNERDIFISSSYGDLKLHAPRVSRRICEITCK